jgi:hypothetical protein
MPQALHHSKNRKKNESNSNDYAIALAKGRDSF